MSLILARLASIHRTPPVTGVTSRYWRIYITANQSGDSYINCGLIGLNKIKGDLTNQCPGISGTATQSSIYGGAYASIYAWNNPNENGSLGSSFWHSNSQSPPWWTVFDCGAGKTITAAQLALMGANVVTRMPKDFKVQKSTDGSAWIDVKSFTGITGWTAATVKFFDLV